MQQFNFLEKPATTQTKENYNMLQEPIEYKFSGYQLMISFEHGIIISYDFLNQVVACLYNYDFDKKETIKSKTVVQLIVMPEREGDFATFFAVFEDATIIRYYFNIEASDQEFIQQIESYQKQFQIYQSQKFKQISKIINEVKIVCYSNPNYQEFTINSGQCNFISLEKITDTKAQNPKAFLKFNTTSITQAAIIDNEFFKKFYPKENDNQLNPLILVFTGTDGVLRFFDYNEKIIIFAYECSLSGIISFTFSDNYRFIALACEDDKSILLDLQTFTYYQFCNHKSFITSIQFFQPQKNVSSQPNLENEIIRLIIASLDSNISMVEFNPDQKYQELQKSCQIFRSSIIQKRIAGIKNYKQYPIICSEKNIDGIQIDIPPENVFFKTQRDLSIGKIQIIDNNYLLISCYDGSLILLTIQSSEQQQAINPNSYGFQYSFTEKNTLDQKFKDIKKQYQKFQQMKKKVMNKNLNNFGNEEVKTLE